MVVVVRMWSGDCVEGCDVMVAVAVGCWACGTGKEGGVGGYMAALTDGREHTMCTLEGLLVQAASAAAAAVTVTKRQQKGNVVG